MVLDPGVVDLNPDPDPYPILEKHPMQPEQIHNPGTIQYFFSL